MMELSLLQKITVWAIPMLFAITVHEVAHGWVASWFGDQTARFAGRLTLNPIKHIDPIGTVVLPLIMLAMSNFIFGWAKPVPVDPRNLRSPRRDMAFVALAGPMANFLMALFWGLVAKAGLFLAQGENIGPGMALVYMGSAGIMINTALLVLNLLPLPPLDGAKIFMSLLPRRTAYYYSFIEPYGFFILILLMFSGVLSNIMLPFMLFFISLITQLFGLAI